MLSNSIAVANCSRHDQKIFKDVVSEIEPWNMKETLNVVEKIKKNILDKGGKIYILSDEEKKLYTNDSFSLC